MFFVHTGLFFSVSLIHRSLARTTGSFYVCMSIFCMRKHAGDLWMASRWGKRHRLRRDGASVATAKRGHTFNTGLHQVDSETTPLALGRCPLYQQLKEEEDIHLTHSLLPGRHMTSLTKCSAFSAE